MERVGLDALAERFDAFLIDQYGVLRDDSGVYPLAPVALSSLRNRDKRLIILSNSGRSADDNVVRLAKAGIDASLYDHFVTSGEVAYRLLSREGTSEVPPIFEIASGRPSDLPERLGRLRCATPEAAGLILISGAETEHVSMGTYGQLLAGPAAARIPAICTNPDLQKIGPGGVLLPGAGALAELYELLGGSVRRIGKPDRHIYDHALALLSGIAADRILCIGDSPAHDIAGARAANLACCLVETGVGSSFDPSCPQQGNRVWPKCWLTG
jgi:HAD superfamily hydrolase (TIGR01459 family)